ncbi:glycosyltransferase [Cohnella xylanilytica]|uniref:Glycosyltransferase n=1 Tax=Cohnella xylanilytica TaxID=557555 RepID=A0A841UAH5_9BACL|nr:glycosyltransferase [Cohnella xylanilytica]MBB6694971.1 glycosyltransferase [Cohnella xylanilytica]
MTSSNVRRRSGDSPGPAAPGAVRIVQVAPDYLPVPPLKYGGIERMVHDLTETLVERGYDVYLYALPGSRTSAKLIPYEHTVPNPEEILRFVERTLPEGTALIHDHTHRSIIGRAKLPVPTLCTIHGSQTNPVDRPVYLSARALEHVGRGQGTYVFNGINLADYPFEREKKTYLLFMGVISWHKGIVQAIDAAEAADKDLIIAGPLYDVSYYRREVEPRLRANRRLRYIGETGGEERTNLLRHAEALLFPTSWEEPFGLIMVETMACGTPVLAFPNGAVPHVMAGFPELICADTDEMAKKARARDYPDPAALRAYVEANFSREKMAVRYAELYRAAIAEGPGAGSYSAEEWELKLSCEKLVREGKLEEALREYERWLALPDVPAERRIYACELAAGLCGRMNDATLELRYALRSFEYGVPRAELLCRIGYIRLRSEEWRQAAYWFEAATRLPKPADPGPLFAESCWSWLPHVQLCVCYSRMGRIEPARRHNDIALSLAPNNEYALHNKRWLDSLPPDS